MFPPDDFDTCGDPNWGGSSRHYRYGDPMDGAASPGADYNYRGSSGRMSTSGSGAPQRGVPQHSRPYYSPRMPSPHNRRSGGRYPASDSVDRRHRSGSGVGVGRSAVDEYGYGHWPAEQPPSVSSHGYTRNGGGYKDRGGRRELLYDGIGRSSGEMPITSSYHQTRSSDSGMGAAYHGGGGSSGGRYGDAPRHG